MNCSNVVTSTVLNQQKLPRLDGLTCLRFLAAFYVFGFHFNIRFPMDLSPYAKNFVSNGAIAMPIFFMLSGFVLTYNYSTTYGNFRSYYQARIARIYPAYFFCIVACLPLLPVHDQIIGSRLVVSIIVLIVISMLLVQAWFPNLFAVWHISGTWSVSVEMFLYAAYPVGRRFTALASKQITILILLLIVASASLIPSLSLTFSRDLPFAVFYVIPPYHVAEFLIGCGIATLFFRHGKNVGWLIPGLMIVPLLGLFGAANSRYMLFNAILLPMIACLIFGFASAGLSSIRALAAIVANPVSRYLGDTSYSFFLMQMPLMLLADQYKDLFSGLTTGQLFMLFLAANQTLASFSYHLVERPGRRALLRYFGKDQRLFPVVVNGSGEPRI